MKKKKPETKPEVGISCRMRGAREGNAHASSSTQTEEVNFTSTAEMERARAEERTHPGCCSLSCFSPAAVLTAL